MMSSIQDSFPLVVAIIGNLDRKVRQTKNRKLLYKNKLKVSEDLVALATIDILKHLVSRVFTGKKENQLKKSCKKLSKWKIPSFDNLELPFLKYGHTDYLELDWWSDSKCATFPNVLKAFCESIEVSCLTGIRSFSGKQGDFSFSTLENSPKIYHRDSTFTYSEVSNCFHILLVNCLWHYASQKRQEGDTAQELSKYCLDPLIEILEQYEQYN